MNGDVVQSYIYDAYGNIRFFNENGTAVNSSPIKNPYTYTGREFDEETGLYYYRARYYDSGTGRFLSEDPIGFAGGDINLYRYVGNDPLNFVDPDGLNCIAVTLAELGAAGGFAIGGPGGAVAGAVLGFAAGIIAGQELINIFANKRDDRESNTKDAIGASESKEKFKKRAQKKAKQKRGEGGGRKQNEIEGMGKDKTNIKKQLGEAARDASDF